MEPLPQWPKTGCAGKSTKSPQRRPLHTVLRCRAAAGESPGAVIRAEVLDFKTDRLVFSSEDAVAARVDWYRPQIRAYMAAVAERYRLAPEQVTGALLFLRGGVKREI